MKVIEVVVLGLFWMGGRELHAQQCDCTQVVGQCSGAVEFIKGYGSNKNYGAEIIVHSSENVCSKVEYYVDSMPYQNVLANKNAEQQSLFGTSPITAQNVAFQRCVICKQASEDAAAAASTTSPNGSASVSSPLEGHWSGTVRWLFASEDEELTVHVSGGRASGNWISRKGGNVIYQAPFDGTVSGNTLNFSYVGDDGTQSAATLTASGDGVGQFRTSGGSIVFSGAMTKAPN